MKCLSTFIFCAVVFAVRAELIQFGRRDSLDYNPDTAVVSKCYDITCPSGTAACSRVIKTSDDLESITKTYKCENANGETLHSESETAANPYPGVKVQSFSFSGVYHFSNSNAGGNYNPVVEDDDRYNYERNKYNTNDLDSQVETFDR